ncbi:MULTISPECIES: DUF5071 domain-containing protein [Paenibacillus]|uniref:DUF5071 domain-containing protein n=1 Tax=Paenibacillus TaxID=44249 RepID=UPI001C8DF7BC|nr:DUF5071 domain-containing protein [Paenibacillus typhae]MBY0014090.1 DUF5071 domain-containing protein [Paenibacillus typhae]
MEDVEHLLFQLHWNTPNDDLELAKIKLKELQDHELLVLVQPMLDKSLWDNAADLLAEIGYPRIRPILYELLSWLQDMNWPGSIIISKLLVSVGEPLIPYIKRALKEGDSIWNYWILIYIVGLWDRGLIEMLSQELYELSSGFDHEGAHIESLRLLSREHILDETTLFHLIFLQKANEKNQENIEDLIEIEKMINSKG